MNRNTLKEVQRWLTNAGFSEVLVAEDGVLRAASTGQKMEIAELVVASAYRFAHQTDLGDDVTVFALASPTGEPVGTFTTPHGSDRSPADQPVIRAIREKAAGADEVRAHAEHDHIAAVFATRAIAEAAVTELNGLGFGSDHLGVAVHGPTHVAFEHDEEVDLVHDAEIGTVTGASLGFLAGVALAALAVPGLGVLGIGGLFAVGAASSFGGAMLGGYLGIAAADRELVEHNELAQTPLDTGEVLIAVCSHGQPETVKALMEHHGGRLLSPGPIITR